jgi:aspartate racemase
MAGPLDISILERCMAEIIRRHEIWRTSYDSTNGQPTQKVHPAQDAFPLRPIDLRSLPGARGEAEADRIIGDLVRQPFDLTEGPLLRARLLRIRDYDYRLSLCAHLSVVDGVSVYRVFPSELAVLYHAFSAQRPSPLLNLPVQFGDYAYWQRHLHDEEQANQRSYWRQQLGGELPVLAWPAGRPRSSRETFRGRIRPFLLPAACNSAAREVSHREGVTLFMTLAATFAALLYQYARQQDIIVGALSPAGRKKSEVEGLLGHFLNPVALRFDLSGNPTFRELLRQAQKLTLEAIANDDVPLEHVAQEIGANRPLFTAAVSLQPPTPQLDLKWSVTSMDVDSGGSPWNLYLAFIDRPGEMMARVQYNPSLFEEETIGRMLQDFQFMLESVCTWPGKRLNEFSFMSALEHRERHARGRSPLLTSSAFFEDQP